MDAKKTFPTDHANVKADKIDLLDNIRTLKDYPLVVVFSAGTTGLQWWIMYAKERIGLTMGGGCTGDGAPQIYPFLQAGQLIGLIPGIKGAAEYETLLDAGGMNEPGRGLRRMGSQTFGHMIIVLFVVIGNVSFLMTRKRRSKRSDAAP